MPLIRIRSASLDDAQRLLQWRNDPLTRIASFSEKAVSLSSHLAWLKASLASEERQIWVAEWQGEPVGTCRADRLGEVWELSWTLAPEVRGRGLAVPMIQATIANFPQHFVAKVKADNLASQKVARKVGFKLVKVEQGVQFYQYPQSLN